MFLSRISFWGPKLKIAGCYKAPTIELLGALRNDIPACVRTQKWWKHEKNLFSPPAFLI